MSNPLLGGTSPRYQRRPHREKTDLHATAVGSDQIFEAALDHSSVGFGRDRASERSGGYKGRPKPPPMSNSTAAKRHRSDLHQPKREIRPPALPRSKDTQIYGSPNNAIFGYQSEALAQCSKQYYEQRRRSPRNTSFKKFEQMRGAGQVLQPAIKNQGQFKPGPKIKDPILHGGNTGGQRPPFLKPTVAPSNPRHQSWALQERNLENNSTSGFPILGHASVNRHSCTGKNSSRGALHSNGRYFKPQYLDNKRTSYPRDSPTCNRNGGLKGFDPAKTSVLNGYSCFVKEHHERAIRSGRQALPREKNYRDFEKSSRNEYRYNFLQREKEMKQLCAAPLPMPSAMMSRVQRLQPVAPMGIYQWPRARRW
jgi:hypothetical protein